MIAKLPGWLIIFARVSQIYIIKYRAYNDVLLISVIYTDFC